jgi:glycosyltransferase involved in cell wall biosynthesis
VVSVSETSRKDFMQLFPFIKERISVIGVGIECNPLSYQKRLHNVVLHVGGFTFEKNHKRLLIIFQQLWQQQPALELWLVGDGPLRKEVEQQAVAMQLSNVKFLGYRSDVLTLMQQATVVVLPSIIEGLPGVILEAMYCQTPVVAYDVGGISEVVKHGETGWLITKKDEEAFVTAVRQVLEGKQVEQVTQQAHQLVVHDFDNKVIAKRFEEVYRTVTSKERAQY